MAFGKKKKQKKSSRNTQPQNPYTEKNADMNHNPFYSKSTESEGKEILTAIVTALVCLALTAVIVVNFSMYFGETSLYADGYSTDSSSENGTTEDQQADSGSDSSGSSQNDFAYTDNSSVDLSQCLTTDAYETITSEDGTYSFGYPKYMFNYSSLDQGVYTFAYNSSSETEYQLKVYKESNSGDAVSNANTLYSRYASTFYSTYFHMVSDSTDSQGMARALLAGYLNSEEHDGEYVIAANDGSYNYILEFQYYDENKDNIYKNINYVVDCVYRYCSFSGTTYQPRTFSQFQSDDMGDKK